MKKLFLALFLVSSCAVSQQRPPKLIIYISIDQMRADYFARYGKYFTGGLHRLHGEGITYTNADLNYATSETGPGHATLGTGCYPWKSGIHGNEWIEIATLNDMYCVTDTAAQKVDGVGGGVSPKNLAVTAIGDWLKKQSPRSKVITASTKDRAAILMGGKNPDAAYWYSKSVGGMVTSDYYVKSLPAWVKEFNSSGWAEKNVPDLWTKSLNEAEYAQIGPDDYPNEGKWNGVSVFPLPFTKGKKAEQVTGTPYGDQLVLDFALNAVRNEQLGARGVTDLLCVSLSNCDYVGHAMGPDSHEMLDLLVKIDRFLGRFFADVEAIVGKENIVIALSADHAVCPLPEFNAQYRNIPAKRYQYATEIKAKLDSLSAQLKKELKTEENVIIKNAFLNYAAGAKAGVDSLTLEQRVKEGLLSIDAYVDIYFRRELISREKSDKPYIEKYRHSYFIPRGEDYQYRIRENCIISSRNSGATHGSPYRYDTNVPVLFWWSGVKRQTIDREIHSADVAPTLAKYAGFSFPANLDGAPLPEIVR